eukprot:IDg6321t1
MIRNFNTASAYNCTFQHFDEMVYEETVYWRMCCKASYTFQAYPQAGQDMPLISFYFENGLYVQQANLQMP